MLFGARGLHDLSEAARIETSAADEGSVDVSLTHEIGGVLRFHAAAAVLDWHSVG